MKFGKQLEEYELPEWKGHYIPYKQLKKRLEELVNQPTSVTNSADGTPLGTPRDLKSAWGSHAGPWRGTGALEVLHKVASRDKILTSLEKADDPSEWLRDVESEAVRVGDFVERGLQGLELQLKDLAKMSESLRCERATITLGAESTIEEDGTGEEESFLELRVLQAVGRVSEGVQRLRSFAELNHAALYKILKKHDKLLKLKIGLGEIFPRLVKVTRLADMSRLDALDSDLKRLSSQSSNTEDIDASPEVARLIAGLGRSGLTVGGAAVSSTHRSELVLSFFLGSSTALFLSIGLLLALPEKSPKTFSEAYLLTPMPVFRVVFSFLLILWCMGAVARVCDQWDINHMFILNVDPRCRVTPEFFFSRAAALTTTWILIFGMYVVDYKWRLIPTVAAHEGFNKRSSLHFVFYPVLLLFLTFLGLLWPSVICRGRYKTSVLRAVKRTGLAPLFPVDFADNMVGDIMTSIAKPMEDVPAAICYLVSHHPQPEDLVRRFIKEGDTCSETTQSLALPIIAGLPFLFRLMQCARRFSDTREVRHLWNLGKYACSLLVVVISRVDDQVLLVIVSTVATVYAFIWDVCLDWGLSLRDFLGTYPEREEIQTPSSPKVAPSKARHPERHFPKRVYWICSFLNLIARSTWVFTLMPTSIVTGNIVGRVVLVSVMSSVEILRRGIWAVLRMEYEQVSNASGFRALLWVPSKLNSGGAGITGKGVEKPASTVIRMDSDAKKPLLSP
mmetsp:Transcript_66822/g.118316  ORF Transcript_66822/g.118316 Transcript_66822/m.118316 type:complete len:733 (-) Transcript_66822:73-2271(-)